MQGCMLMYLSCGWRYDHEAPPKRLDDLPKRPRRIAVRAWEQLAHTRVFQTAVVPGDRPNWEIYAVLSGKLAVGPTSDRGAQSAYRERTLWIHPPGSCHTWRTPPGTAAHVLVFHFAAIPATFEKALGPSRTGEIGFRISDRAFLQQLFLSLAADYRTPSVSSLLLFEAAACQLGHFFLSHQESLHKCPAFDPAAAKINTAISYFREHIGENPDVHDVARAIGVSPGYMRALFLRVEKAPPKKIFADLMVARAKELLIRPDLSLKEVATHCGFLGYSQFHRAFRNHEGISPSQWINGERYGVGNSLNVSA